MKAVHPASGLLFVVAVGGLLYAIADPQHRNVGLIASGVGFALLAGAHLQAQGK
jgi:hypothetical protein